MSYAHPVLVPGAMGHDDSAYLRQVIESIYQTRKDHQCMANRLDVSAARLRRVAQETSDALSLLGAVEEDIDDIREELEKP